MEKMINYDDAIAARYVEGIKYHFIHNISSPRTMHDDSLIIIDQRETNECYGNKILIDNKYIKKWVNLENNKNLI